MSWEDLQGAVFSLFAELDGRERLDQAYEEQAAWRAAQRQDDAALGVHRVLPRRRRQPLEERLDELAERARRHFAAQDAEALERGRRGRPPRFATEEERRAYTRTYQREYHREWRARRAAAAARPRVSAPEIAPVGRPPEVEARIAASLVGSARYHEKRRQRESAPLSGALVWRPTARGFELLVGAAPVAYVYWQSFDPLPWRACWLPRTGRGRFAMAPTVEESKRLVEETLRASGRLVKEA